jgi:hypothetical protein
MPGPARMGEISAARWRGESGVAQGGGHSMRLWTVRRWLCTYGVMTVSMGGSELMRGLRV